MFRSAAHRARRSNVEDRGVRNDDRELTARVRDESPADEASGATPGEFGPGPSDAGRTSGGGSLGHKQPQDVPDATGIRNHPSDRRPARDTSTRD
jgi:hypothetical protein